MKTAFGRAMLTAYQNPEQEVTFWMTSNNNPPFSCSSSDFLTLRQDEKNILSSLDLSNKKSVLDYGCGLGRHLKFIRSKYPHIHCTGIEACDLLRSHCQQQIQQPCDFVSEFFERKETSYDLILLLGNGLGILGNEKETELELANLKKNLNPGGKLLIESAGTYGNNFTSVVYQIGYEKYTDPPFEWGHADRKWMLETLENLEFAASIIESDAPMPGVFFALAEKAD